MPDLLEVFVPKVPAPGEGGTLPHVVLNGVLQRKVGVPLQEPSGIPLQDVLLEPKDLVAVDPAAKSFFFFFRGFSGKPLDFPKS